MPVAIAPIFPLDSPSHGHLLFEIRTAGSGYRTTCLQPDGPGCPFHSPDLPLPVGSLLYELRLGIQGGSPDSLLVLHGAQLAPGE